MKRLPNIFLLILLALVIFLLSLLPHFFVKSTGLISPQLKLEKVLGVNLWFPQNSESANLKTSAISARAALFVDSETGQVLYSKNPHERLPIASLVKIMTVVVALEYRTLTDEFTVTSQAASMEPDKMFLKPGEKLTLEELLYGIFLISANDAAETLAEDTTGSRDEFLQMMNLKASQLGMKDTYYSNPTGLDEDTNNSYSTAYDLAILTRYAIKRFPILTQISGTYHMFLPQTSDHQDYDMYSGINLLTTYPGVIGFKTGNTPEAGLTLITLAQKNGHRVIGVILGSEDRRDEAKSLLDLSFARLN